MTILGPKTHRSGGVDLSGFKLGGEVDDLGWTDHIVGRDFLRIARRKAISDF
jgi:hypothetical protein